jgi:hypothetical protein
MSKEKENDMEMEMEIDVLDQNDHIITIRLHSKNRLKKERLHELGATKIQIYQPRYGVFDK